MEIRETGKTDDRVAALEKKTEEMEALLKGLMAEMLDFKALAKNLARQTEERHRQVTVRGPVVQETVSQPGSTNAPAAEAAPQENHTVIHVKSAQKPEAAPAEPDMVRIMQSDGTMKMEVRRGDKNPRR
ncbi:MAG: hypothetical protein WC367_00285 [Methanoregula sp.]